jgi:hypothetical protein
MKRAIAGIFAAAILLAALWCYREYTSEVTSLSTARQALIRVDSGVQYDSVINLRSKIADADAAVTTFELGRHLFGGDAAKMEVAKRGLAYIDIAIDDAKEIRDWSDMERYTDVTTWVPRTCADGQLAFWPALVVQPFLGIGHDLVRQTVGEPALLPSKPPVAPLNYSKESTDCVHIKETQARETAAESAAKAQLALQQEAKWKYHVQISNPDGCGFAPYQDGDRGPQTHATAFYFHANDSVGLVDAVCVHGERNPASHHLAVTINGKRIDVDWRNQDNWYYEAMPVWGDLSK